MTSAKYRAVSIGGCLQAEVERRPDGVVVLRSTEPLQAYPRRLTDRLEHWAAEAPERTLVAKRVNGGDWRRISFAQMLERVQRVGQALAQRRLSADRPVVILSDNDIEHLTLALACQWVGVPYAPTSPAYSLVSKDFAKLRHVIDTLTPGLVFASHAGPYANAIQAVVPADVELVFTEGRIEGRHCTGFDELLAATPGNEVAAAHDRVGPDTIAKFLFTSGSTKNPKAVINTQRMLCANMQMTAQCMKVLTEEPPVLVDWLPWNHTFGGNQNVGLVVYHGGTLYIDEGKPTAAGIAETLRNLREISPTIYFNVPKGLDEIASAMERDAELRHRFFARVKAFMFAGAGLSQATWDALNRLAEQAVGERICVFTGLGMTETAPSCTFALGPQVQSGHIGLPCPAVEVKLVPDGDDAYAKTEIRFRGPNVMPGYWRASEQTAEAFDEEGFYRTGDAVKWIDPADPQKGLLFDGRTAEDFKLGTGTFVSVGPLKARVVLEGAPLVQDAVLTGLNRGEVGALVFARVDECRLMAGLPTHAQIDEVLRHAAVREFFQRLADRLWVAGTGSANRVARLHVLVEPPSIDRGEITDKGSINQRAVLAHRAHVVSALYDAPHTLDVFLPGR